MVLRDYLTEKKNSNPNQISKEDLYEKRINRILDDDSLNPLQVFLVILEKRTGLGSY